jgi:hypothetical protein
MCIITGPNIDMAIKLIKRMKALFERKLGLVFQNKETVLELNGFTIEAYPSNHIDSFRSLDKPKFILLDEADFFRKHEQEEVRHVSERYIGKSNPYIVMVSTPNNPGGLFYSIEREPEATCLYRRIKMDYQYGLGKIYDPGEIEKARLSPGFGREYELQYLGKIGNVFSEILIERAVELGEQYKALEINQYTHHFGGIDPGWSKITPVYIGEVLKEEGCVRIIHYKGFDKSTPDEVARYVHKLSNNFSNLWWFVDGADRGFVNTMKGMFRESEDWVREEDVAAHCNRVIPVNFAKHHKTLLENFFVLLSGGHIAIPKGYDRLIIALRTAQATEWNLNKDESVNHDDLDSLRLLLKAIKFGGIS